MKPSKKKININRRTINTSIKSDIIKPTPDIIIKEVPIEVPSANEGKICIDTGPDILECKAYYAIDIENNKELLPKDAEKQKIYRCLMCNKFIRLRDGDIKIAHFYHCATDNYDISASNIADTTGIKPITYNNESLIHRKAKNILADILENHNLTINIYCSCERLYEVLEILKPSKSSGDKIIEEYEFMHNDTKRIADIAYVCDDNIVCIFEVCYTNKTSEINRPDPWFEFDAKEIIAKYAECRSNIKNITLNCLRKRHLKSCACEPQKEGIIYHNQRGAGCGKTYESIQLIEKDDRFKRKTHFIYLTKLHSAVNVISEEFNNQFNAGKLPSLNKKSTQPNSNSKQIIHELHHSSYNKHIHMIIGTIDSFNYAIQKHITESDDDDEIIGTMFKRFTKLIAKNKLIKKDECISYAGHTFQLNEFSVIIIDEAQDLSHDYLDAYNHIRDQTNADIYIIGDKLQSIWGDNNIHTSIKNYDGPHIQKSDPVNHVMRFHNKKFIEFVNDVIDFKKHELEPIKSICDGTSCKYLHEDDITPYEVFNLTDNEDYYKNIPDYDEQVETVRRIIEHKIINHIERLTNEHHYTPENFMFIFPFMKGNIFAPILQLKLEEYWGEKFNSKEYTDVVYAENIYWQEFNVNRLKKYSHIHKSEEGESINLKESEHMTRILTIHSSKGLGCECVFLLDISESAFEVYNKQNTASKNLVYDSLLHVSITRQKKHLYIGLTGVSDDIYNRFAKYIQDKDKIYGKNTLYISDGDLIKYISDNEIQYKAYKDFIDNSQFKKAMDTAAATKGLVDYCHHIIRNAVMSYRVKFELIMIQYKKEKNESDQHITILRTIARKEITILDYNGYCKHIAETYRLKKKINQNTEDKKAKDAFKHHPIPIFLSSKSSSNDISYKYCYIVESIISNIQRKIKIWIEKEECKFNLCPIESIIFMYMIEITQQGKFSNISITDVYHIMDIYESSVAKNELEYDKDQFGCLCIDKFKYIYKTNQEFINGHYANIKYVKKICKEFMAHIKIQTPIKYLVDQSIYYRNNGYLDDAINLKIRVAIIGYTDKFVIPIILIPDLNDMNLYKTTIKAILYYHFIKTHPDDKFANKEIIVGIISLNKGVYLINEIDLDNDIAIKTIEEYLTAKYNDSNRYFCEYFIKNKMKYDRSKYKLYDYQISVLHSISINRINEKEDIEKYLEDSVVLKVANYLHINTKAD